MIKNEMVLKEVVRQMIKGKAPAQCEMDLDVIGAAVEESIRQGKEKILTVPKGFYTDLKYDLDIDITGESVDTRVRQATRFAIIQAITADPSLIQDPFKRKMLISWAEDGGVNLNEDLDPVKKDVEEISPADSGRAGGGVSAPAVGGRELAGRTTQTV